MKKVRIRPHMEAKQANKGLCQVITYHVKDRGNIVFAGTFDCCKAIVKKFQVIGYRDITYYIGDWCE